VWSPDDQTVAFRSNRGDTLDIYATGADAVGGDKLLLKAAALRVPTISLSPTDWSRDGRWLLFFSSHQAASRDLWVLPMGQGDTKPRLILGTKSDESNAKFSPDGRWILYQTNESGRFEIAVRAFPAGERMWQISSGGGVHGRWSSDGRELYFMAPDGKLMAAQVDTRGPLFRAGSPVALFSPRLNVSPNTNPFNSEYDVAADGRFLVNTTLDEFSTTPITLILNWNAGRR
jgi:Tol biopolymer transport system component